MNVNGINSTGLQPNTAGMGAGSGGQTDPVSKDLQKQIEKLQQDLKEISADQNMPTDSKIKKKAGNPTTNQRAADTAPPAPD